MPRVELVQKHNMSARRLFIRANNGKVSVLSNNTTKRNPNSKHNGKWQSVVLLELTTMPVLYAVPGMSPARSGRGGREGGGVHRRGVQGATITMQVRKSLEGATAARHY
jgi:hypothetical protein